jgi:hypothetical protein
MMVEMVDLDEKGGVNVEDFIRLMRELGLINQKKDQDKLREQEEILSAERQKE